MKSIKNLFSVCLMAYNFKKDGADIKLNLKQGTVEFIGNGYHETVKL